MPNKVFQNRRTKNISRIDKKLACSPPENVMQELRIYSHNVSGSRTKINKLNDFLAVTNCDIIVIQETWWNDTINSNEILASTEFTMCRSDRNFESMEVTEGGGLAIIIRNGIEYEELTLLDAAKLEHQLIRARFLNTYFCFLNVYITPGTAALRKTMIRELDVIFRAIRIHYPSDSILMLGDFNMPNVNWIIANDNDDLLTPSQTGLTPYERQFIKLVGEQGLHQFNRHLNVNGRILDLVLSTLPTDIIVERAAS